MSNIWLGSDWHLGHKGISNRFRTQFSSDESHDMYFFEEYIRLVSKRDIVYFLGDMVFDSSKFELFNHMTGDKRLILGNHDLQHCKLEEFQQHFTQISGPIKKWNMWLTHIPMHPNELYGKINLHGHVHGNTINDDRYVNLCPEFLIENFGRPLITLDELRNWLKYKESINERFLNFKKRKGII